MIPHSDGHGKLARQGRFRDPSNQALGRGHSDRPSATPAFDAPAGHGELILLVDDNRPVCEFLATILEKRGFKVLSCGDGVQAISQFTAHAPHIELVITDVDMPPFSGAVLARVMLQLRPDLRLIAISGLSSGEVADSDIEMIKKLAHAFLSKPFAPEDLLGTVHGRLHPSFKP